MTSLTDSERRAALTVLLLLLLGTARDAWRARHPHVLAPPAIASAAGASASAAMRVAAPAVDSRAPVSATGGLAPIDLNRADASELDALPGVGPVLAGRILEHRRTHGPFRRVEELMAVRGIGPRLFARIRSHVTLSGDGAKP